MRQSGHRCSSSERDSLGRYLVVRSGLTLTLTLRLVTDLLFCGSASHGSGALGLGSGLFAGGALQLLAFDFVGYILRIHQFRFSPAYFSTSFFNPIPGKFTVILASSPSPSRRTTVPVPYFGCCTVWPVRVLRTGGGLPAKGFFKGVLTFGLGSCGCAGGGVRGACAGGRGGWAPG